MQERERKSLFEILFASPREGAESFFLLLEREFRISIIVPSFSVYISQKFIIAGKFRRILPEKNRNFEITPSFLFFYLSISFFFNEEPIVSGIRGRECFYIVYFYQDRLDGSTVEIAVTRFKDMDRYFEKCNFRNRRDLGERERKKNRQRNICTKIYRSVNRFLNFLLLLLRIIHFR